MPNQSIHAPRDVPQVMVSSTFTDLAEHRLALIAAINVHGLHPRVMEHDSARLVDVIESSFQMVQESAAYILLISHKYGQTPECQKGNPDQLSITELEFNEAQRLRRPTLLFIMGEDHAVKPRDVETDPAKKAKLNAFRERAKRAAADSLVQRVYAVFNSLEEFKDKINPPLVELKKHLDSPTGLNIHPGHDIHATTTLSPAIREYLRRLEAATSKLQLIGLGQGVQIELPIQQAYIPLNVVVAHGLKDEQPFHFDDKALRQREHFEENVLLCDIFKWATRLDSRGVLLLGDPGAGKTTGARQFCWRLLRESDLPKTLGLPAGTLPVFLRLRQLTTQHLAKGAVGWHDFIND